MQRVSDEQLATINARTIFDDRSVALDVLLDLRDAREKIVDLEAYVRILKQSRHMEHVDHRATRVELRKCQDSIARIRELCSCDHTAAYDLKADILAELGDERLGDE